MRSTRLFAALPAAALLAFAMPVLAQTTAPTPATPDSATPAEPVVAPDQIKSDSTPAPAASGGGTDIFSRNTLSVLLDGRLVLANGAKSWAKGGFGKTRFDGTSTGDYKLEPLPMEADLIWTPRFTNTLTANVSAAWQRNQENAVDLLESYLSFQPPSSGKLRFALKGGLYWPEISLEHATGGAWSTVYTITPSAINSWAGEEVKVIGAEATLTLTAGTNDFALTGAVFGFNDTSGTLLSFRGWALQDSKATAFGHFPLPPLNTFMTRAQQNETRSLYELDHRVGFYGRFEWRPQEPLSLNIFYYDNRGNPEAFSPRLQWGWRTRFVNVGLSADLSQNTRLLMQGMYGTTQMGFKTNGVVWVNTKYESAYVLITHSLGKAAVTGRVEAFGTHERGSQMSPLEGENGWAVTGDVRYAITPRVTAFFELLHVRSDRPTRARIGLPGTEHQTVAQAELRVRI